MSPTKLLSGAPLSRASLAEAVYQSILDAILAGRLAAGADLSEVALAADLGVSRTPVHEALKRLVADGLVEQLPNRQARLVRFTRQQVAEIYEMRLLLEPRAAELAATRLEPAQLVALRDAADALGATAKSRNWNTRALDFDIRFHDLLARACGNERLRAAIGQYRRLVRAFCRSAGSADNLQQAFREHLEILESLEARDGKAARRAMAAHIEARLQAVLAAFDG
jgi:DNA-binding GntR family transcriptional regulator